MQGTNSTGRTNPDRSFCGGQEGRLPSPTEEKRPGNHAFLPRSNILHAAPIRALIPSSDEPQTRQPTSQASRRHGPPNLAGLTTTV